MSDDLGLILDTVEPAFAQRIHLLGVGGTGMGSFAGLLKAAGYQVTGSDENVYPPMADMLKAWGIDALTPYSAANLDVARPDLVIVGNVIRKTNLEATAVRERRLPQMSFPAALGSLFLKPRHSIVVAGTHGKTTTSSLMAHVLVEAGRDPSFLVGGVTQNYAGNYRLGRGPHFVVEGDEYDTAWFDKGPKFLHYQAKTLVLTSIEFDHADIYRDLAHYEAAFERLVGQLGADTTLVVSASWPNAVRLARSSRAKVVTYSAKPKVEADVVPRDLHQGAEGVRFTVGGTSALLPMAGLHNVENALAVWAAASSLGVAEAEIAGAFASFAGVKRRQELRGEPDGVLVIDDFAHHPTAVRETLDAVASRFTGRRLWAIFEPRSNTSRRNIHQHDYARAFGSAQRVSLKVPRAPRQNSAGRRARRAPTGKRPQGGGHSRDWRRDR
jgi:UDP-N-acetylmuramate: L-alanyl-gamma-D-glutamyl-meso-diaminopimelate ligase